MDTAIFGPDLYAHKEGKAEQLATDMRIIKDTRRSWRLDMGPRLFDSRNPVGRYDKHMHTVVMKESEAWTRPVNDYPNIPLPMASPPRLGFVPRGRFLLKAMAQALPVSDTPFWHGVAEQVYGFSWCLVDNTVLCHKCVIGHCSTGVFCCFPDYLHFLEDLPTILDAVAQSVQDYINHVHQDHSDSVAHHKVMDSWMMCVQSIYLDVLHPKATRMRFPADELQSIKYRLIGAAGRALALHVQLEQHPIVGDDKIVDAVGFASTVMHDICDLRHDNTANEYYNLLTIVTAHKGVCSGTIMRRFCVDVWAWAIDHGALWAIHHAGRELVWQIYMARYKTPILLDNLHPPTSEENWTVDPYCDEVVNSFNPLPRSSDPYNYNLRDRCENVEEYDRLLDGCLTHFQECPDCKGYDKASWEERVPLIGNTYRKKYHDCSCLNTISTYMILASPDRLWWLADPTAAYTGPTAEWSNLLC